MLTTMSCAASMVLNKHLLSEQTCEISRQPQHLPCARPLWQVLGMAHE